tara:strand:+ start:640 stop:1236 length:597 start_codon:yes stop_codon:yes gene_type:complete
MKKIFKKLFSIDRIDLIKKNFKVKNPNVLEIGVHRGDFSKRLKLNFYPKKLVLVDPWIAFDEPIYKKSWYGKSDSSAQTKQDNYYNDVISFFKNEIVDKKIEVYRLTSDNFFLNNAYKFDLIYIDGNHLFDFVKKDISNSLNFLNKNGIVVLDDYSLSGWWKDGVTKAVKYFEKNKTVKIIERHNFLNQHHQCIIKKF